jgi:hypothetical protein
MSDLVRMRAVFAHRLLERSGLSVALHRQVAMRTAKLLTIDF